MVKTQSFDREVCFQNFKLLRKNLKLSIFFVTNPSQSNNPHHVQTRLSSSTKFKEQLKLKHEEHSAELHLKHRWKEPKILPEILVRDVAFSKSSQFKIARSAAAECQ